MAKKMERSLEALITIVDYSLAHQLKKLYKRDELPFYILSHGYGSATLDIYDLLGFGSPKKLIALSIQSTSLTQQILARLRERIDLYRAGTGIAFTIPLDSSSSILWQICQQADQDNTYAGREDQTMEEKKPYALIVTIVDRGHSDLVMTAAKRPAPLAGRCCTVWGWVREKRKNFWASRSTGKRCDPDSGPTSEKTPDHGENHPRRRVEHERSRDLFLASGQCRLGSGELGLSKKKLSIGIASSTVPNRTYKPSSVPATHGSRR